MLVFKPETVRVFAALHAMVCYYLKQDCKITWFDLFYLIRTIIAVPLLDSKT